MGYTKESKKREGSGRGRDDGRRTVMKRKRWLSVRYKEESEKRKREIGRREDWRRQQAIKERGWGPRGRVESLIRREI